MPDIKQYPYFHHTQTLPQISTVGIVGAGLMGVSIAAANARCGIPVRIYDADEGMLETVPQRVWKELDTIQHEVKRENLASLVKTIPFDGLKKCNLVIECIIEKEDDKKSLYEKLEALLPEDAFLVTNTSTIPIERLAAGLNHPRRFAGMHFLHPVRYRELVEVIASTQTDEGVLQRVCDYALYIEKTPLCVADCPGFVINRLLQPYLNEALNLLIGGVSMERLEAAATKFGMTWGPLRIMDEIGLDTVFHSGRVLFEAYPNQVTPSPIIVSMMKKKLLGRKTGRGFYAWDTGEEFGMEDAPPAFNDEMDAVFALWRQPEKQYYAQYAGWEIAGRLMTSMAMEAARIVRDEVVSGPDEVDMAAVTGLGFPEKYGGPIRWMAEIAKRDFT